MSVRVEKLSKRFGRQRVLREIDATFDFGSIAAIVGANGSGKTTLLRILATMTKPTAGRVLYGMAGASAEAARAEIGWVGHDVHCYPELTPRENLRFFARLYRVNDPNAVDERIAELELGLFADRPVRALSRGQRQRVSLARALVHSPKLLLLDEPTTGLDARSQQELAACLARMAARGAAVLVVSHDALWLRSLGGRSFEMANGRLTSM